NPIRCRRSQSHSPPDSAPHPFEHAQEISAQHLRGVVLREAALPQGAGQVREMIYDSEALGIDRVDIVVPDDRGIAAAEEALEAHPRLALEEVRTDPDVIDAELVRH